MKLLIVVVLFLFSSSTYGLSYFQCLQLMELEYRTIADVISENQQWGIDPYDNYTMIGRFYVKTTDRPIHIPSNVYSWSTTPESVYLDNQVAVKKLYWVRDTAIFHQGSQSNTFALLCHYDVALRLSFMPRIPEVSSM